MGLRQMKRYVLSAGCDELIDTCGQWKEELPRLVEAVYSNNINDQLPATMQFRKLLSKEKNPPIEEVIEANVIPRFVEFLRSPVSTLQVRFPIMLYSCSLFDAFSSLKPRGL